MGVFTDEIADRMTSIVTAVPHLWYDKEANTSS
jgi:hypothetical protein